jgi:hypothetical protein
MVDDAVVVGWVDGKVAGDPELVRAVLRRCASGELVGFNYWENFTPSVRAEFDAYVTIGCVLEELFGRVTVDAVPENPDGYQEEGPVGPDAEAAETVV